MKMMTIEQVSGTLKMTVAWQDEAGNRCDATLENGCKVEVPSEIGDQLLKDYPELFSSGVAKTAPTASVKTAPKPVV